MNKEQTDTFIQYLDTRTSAIQDEITRLVADNRRDEGDFEKIRANIFQMAKTIFQASQKAYLEDSESVKFFDSRLTMIEHTWRTSLDKAKDYQDDQKILQEQVKLEAMDEIRTTYKRIWEASL